jgi:hypothetical protein
METTGYYQVDHKKLAALGADDVAKLHCSGAMALAYAQYYAASNFQRLIADTPALAPRVRSGGEKVASFLGAFSQAVSTEKLGEYDL